MAILKHIASKSSNYGAALEYLIFKHDELRKTPILDQNGNRIMRDEFYLDGLNCEPYSFDAACQQLNREYQKNKNKNEIKSHHYIISFDPAFSVIQTKKPVQIRFFFIESDPNEHLACHALACQRKLQWRFL